MPAGRRPVSLEGQRFGRLTVVGPPQLVTVEGGKRQKSKHPVQCDCGGTALVFSGNLRAGTTQSCGCLHRETVSANAAARRKESPPRTQKIFVRRMRNGRMVGYSRDRNHGQSKTRLYRIWKGMRERCYDTHAQNYRFYGARGVTVCEEWRHDFLVFKEWADNHGYESDLELDRKDSSKGYSPQNCRWLTKADNVRRARRAFPPALDEALTVYAARHGLSRAQVIEDALVAYLD